MSTLRNPVGPKSRKVYMRRRLIVLAVLVAVIAVIVLAIVKPGGQKSAPATDSKVEVPKDLPDTSGSTDASSKKKSKTPACEPTQLAVTAVTDKTDYEPGENPKLALRVENTGKKACSADLGTKGMLFEVSSGDDQVWRSTDCQKDPQSTVVLIEPGKPLDSEAIQWDRTRSSPETCEVTREPVAAGGASYHLRVTAGGVQSAQTAQFLLF